MEQTINLIEDKKIIKEHISAYNNNLNPKNNKGLEYQQITYAISENSLLDELVTVLTTNISYTYTITIQATHFDDLIGLKIAKIIANNRLTSLKILNRSNPFSDRVAINIGQALAKNTNLKILEIFLNTDHLSLVNICEFVTKPSSQLERLSYIKIKRELLIILSNYLNRNSNLKSIGFYYEPLKSVDLLYQNDITEDIYFNLGARIESDSNITEIELIPLNEDYIVDINLSMTESMNQIRAALQLFCATRLKEQMERIDIEHIFTKENEHLKKIM